uniref:glutamate cyclase domain-containing protein n=1 Tax=Thermococcus sp. TaxID=35749 RepID=UPI0026202E58
ETDELVVSAVSNWGAYGLVAELSLKTEKNLLKGWEEEFVVRVLVKAGLIDGVSKKREVSVDGIPMRIHGSVLETLEGYVDWRLG